MFTRFAFAAALAVAPGLARADVFALKYQQPGLEAPFAAAPGAVQGTEAFDARSQSAFGATPSFTTTFGTGGVLSGTYSGTMGVFGADQYGGAGSAGNYIVSFAQADGYKLTLSSNGVIPGFNQFGMQISALDAGNRLDFLRAGQIVFSYTPEAMIRDLGSCTSGNAYCGNPTTEANGREQYAFVSFLDRTGYFDQVWFHQVGIGGFETDNHTVGYLPPSSAQAATFVDIPEPHAVALLGAGLVALGMARRRRNPGAG